MSSFSILNAHFLILIEIFKITKKLYIYIKRTNLSIKRMLLTKYIISVKILHKKCYNEIKLIPHTLCILLM
jgi:hypothetical protein